MPNANAQKLFRLRQQLEKCLAALAAAKLQQGLFPSFQDLDHFLADYEKAKQEAIAQAVAGASLDWRQCRRAFGPPPPAPG